MNIIQAYFLFLAVLVVVAFERGEMDKVPVPLGIGILAGIIIFIYKDKISERGKLVSKSRLNNFVRIYSLLATIFFGFLFYAFYAEGKGGWKDAQIEFLWLLMAAGHAYWFYTTFNEDKLSPPEITPAAPGNASVEDKIEELLKNNRR